VTWGKPTNIIDLEGFLGQASDDQMVTLPAKDLETGRWVEYRVSVGALKRQLKNAKTRNIQSGPDGLELRPEDDS